MKTSGPIFIVDDDHLLLKEILENLKVTNPVLFFHDGFEFLKYLRKSTVKPFMILCDVNMPPINGLDLRKLICEDKYLKKMSIPYIFFSSEGRPSDVKQAYDLTAQGYFLKAKTIEETQHRVKVIIDYWTECCVPSEVEY